MDIKIRIISTAQLYLRPWVSEEVGELFTILQEKDILHYFPDQSPPAWEKVERYIEHHLTHWVQFGNGHWAVVSRGSVRLLGWNGLEYLPELKETEVAYLLSRQVWGQGYATEAAIAALLFGFGQAYLKSIIGLVHPENARSLRVLEKSGLTFIDRITL